MVLQGIYEWIDAGVVRKLFGNGCPWVRAIRGQIGELLEPMARAARMIDGDLEGIFDPLASRAHDALHGGAQLPVLSRKVKARGYRTVENMTAMLHFFAAKLTLPCY
jgi:hypothetical protein